MGGNILRVGFVLILVLAAAAAGFAVDNPLLMNDGAVEAGAASGGEAGAASGGEASADSGRDLARGGEASAARGKKSGAASGSESGMEAEEESAEAALLRIFAESASPEEMLKALEELGPENMNAEARLVYGILLRDAGRLEKARDVLKAVLEENPAFPEAWFHLALLEHAAGKDGARDKALNNAIKKNPRYAEAHAFQGRLAIAQSNWKQAEASLDKALKYNRQDSESLTGLAWVYAKTDRLEKALELLDEAVELEPGFVYARVDRSRVNAALGNYNAAEEDLDTAIRLEPDVPWHYLDRARIRLKNFQDYTGAQSDLEMVEKLDPGNFFALVYLAGLHDEQRRFGTALKYYTQAIKARPDYYWAYPSLGKLYWMKGDFARAAKWFAKAAPDNPDDFGMAIMAGLSMERSGKQTEARRLYSELIKQYKRTDTAYEVIRFLLERRNDYYAVNALNKEADEKLRERLWFYMGVLYEMEGNTAGAQSVYERISERKGAMEYDMAHAALNGMEG